jgi:hypothetical protein
MWCRSPSVVRFTALICLVCLGLAAGSASAAPGQTMTFEAPRDLLDAGARGPALDELAGLGVQRLRVVLYWRNVAPNADSATRPSFDATDPNRYAWGQYDGLMAAAAQRGWPVLLTVSGPVPKWATSSGKDNVTRPKAAEFQQFMTAVGRWYGAQVKTWSIWNEPNHPQFLGPQYVHGRPTSPRIYRSLFIAARKGLKASGNGGDRVLMGETAPRGTGHDVAPLTFLRGALCLSSKYRRVGHCGRLDADGYAHHAYTTRGGPFFHPPGPNDVTIGVLPRLVRALDRAGRAGAIRRNMGIYLTEFGIQSYPDRLLGVTLAQQAEYIAISEHIAYANRRVKSFSQYLLRDDSPVAGPASQRYSGFESGLRFANGDAKPSLAGFRLPLVARRHGHRASLWGLVRPASGATGVTILYAARGKGFHVVAHARTNGRGYWHARARYGSGGRYRVRWAAPGGAVFTGPPIRAYR